jgi:hypothetical protein
LVNIESIDESSRVPTFLESQEYNVWYMAPQELDGNTLMFSFDYLFTPDSNNDPAISLTLETLEVTSFELLPEED